MINSERRMAIHAPVVKGFLGLCSSHSAISSFFIQTHSAVD
jgi:hypothetical protein